MIKKDPHFKKDRDRAISAREQILPKLENLLRRYFNKSVNLYATEHLESVYKLLDFHCGIDAVLKVKKRSGNTNVYGVGLRFLKAWKNCDKIMFRHSRVDEGKTEYDKFMQEDEGQIKAKFHIQVYYDKDYSIVNAIFLEHDDIVDWMINPRNGKIETMPGGNTMVTMSTNDIKCITLN